MDNAVDNFANDDLDTPAGNDVHDPPADLAASALAGARSLARGRPVRGAGARGSAAARARIRGQNLTGRNTGGYSGPGRDPGKDPHRVGELVAGLVADQGWEQPLAEARVFAEWGALVGADIAAHATPQTLRDGELRITAESTAWATQLRMLASALLARLVSELGPHVVTKLVITGPVAPNWRHGGRTVRGHRGPRDTYG